MNKNKISLIISTMSIILSLYMIYRVSTIRAEMRGFSNCMEKVQEAFKK